MTDMSENVEVTETVFRQYEQVRRSGVTNMVIESNVREAAESMGLSELVEFMDAGHYYDLLEDYDEHADEFGRPEPGEL